MDSLFVIPGVIASKFAFKYSKEGLMNGLFSKYSRCLHIWATDTPPGLGIVNPITSSHTISRNRTQVNCIISEASFSVTFKCDVCTRLRGWRKNSRTVWCMTWTAGKTFVPRRVYKREYSEISEKQGYSPFLVFKKLGLMFSDQSEIQEPAIKSSIADINSFPFSNKAHSQLTELPQKPRYDCSCGRAWCFTYLL